MRNIKLIIEYDGSSYYGWQRLTDKKFTIQGRLEYILEQITGEKIEIIGAGRTDKDVHALGQTANFKTNSPLPINQLENTLNELLPRDIRIISSQEVPDRFHARYNAIMKEYLYQIWNSSNKNVFDRHYFYHIPQTLNLDIMQKAKEFFTGTQDFKNFTAMKSKEKSTVKTIEFINIQKEDEKLFITIKGEGFLHKMVRIIVGTLIEAGLKEKSIQEVRDMFEKPSRITSGFTAPAHALFLKKVYY